MKDLVERGHVFIAQPPLYKVARKSQEVYLKDDGELSQYLLARVADEFRVVVASSGATLEGGELRSAILAAEGWTRTLVQLERRGWPTELVEATLEFDERWPEETGTEGYATALAAEMVGLGYERTRVELDEEHGVSEVVCALGGNGRSVEVRIGRSLGQSGHYRQARKYLSQIAPFRVGPYHLERNGDRETLESLGDLVRHLYEVAKKGLSIQRYKGLGEMNPPQLWATTMDPASRRLLQVAVEDGAKADELFTLLMGDAVEPRRQFIESNALEVRNLDV